MKNIPATHQQVEDLKSGESIISEFPNRRQRRSIGKVPNSTKISKFSANNPNIIRTNKKNITFKNKD